MDTFGNSVKLIGKCSELFNLHQFPTLRTAQPLLDLVNAPATVVEKLNLLAIGVTTVTLCDVGTNRVSGSNKLRTDRPTRKLIPSCNENPNHVTERLSLLK